MGWFKKVTAPAMSTGVPSDVSERRDNPRQFNAAILPGRVAGLSEKKQSVFGGIW